MISSVKVCIMHKQYIRGTKEGFKNLLIFKGIIITHK